MKKILFVIDSLACAGAEKSLITLLNLLDYTKYDVDLQLFGYGEALEELLPKEVNLLKPLNYSNFSSLNLKEASINSIKSLDFSFLVARIKFSTKIRIRKYGNIQKARIFWQCLSSVIEKNEKEYDIAISYAQGIPTFYVADKIKAKNKYAWVNVSYRLSGKDKKFQEQYYNKYKKIVAVSHSTREIFSETFPKYKDKIEVIYDINDPNFIYKMASMNKSYNDNFTGLRILTVGRLANQKGYDIALEACKMLKNEGINFKWYSLGIGPLKLEIEKYIKDNNLEDNFILLGVKSNPYPYFRDCDIYVQTSKFEGFGLAIAEARMLNKPVVTTRFDAVYNQMIDRKNGLVVDMNAYGVTNGILELINNNEVKENIVEYLKNEKKGNVEELDKFYNLIN